jgi:Kef-type K+ transport system membrane component KefB
VLPLAFLVTTPNPSQIPLSLLVVFGSAKLMAELFERAGQPGIVGQILAGILIGPYALGWMAPNEILSVLSDLGVMFLLFRVGLEVKSSELLKVGGTALLVAVGGVILPFLMGWGILALWGAPHVEAIFTGAAMVATSVGITAEVLAAKGLLDERASRIILGAAVIDDVLGLLVLSVVSSMARGQVNFLELSLTAVIALGFTLIVARWGSHTMSHLVPRVQKTLRGSEGEFTLALVLLFALSLLAVYAGVAAIVGAFLAGMALSEVVERRVADLTSGVSELLVPFFLAGVGLHLDLSAFSNARIVWLAAAVLVAAIVSKFAGCAWGAIGLGRRDAFRIGAGMIPRGEVGMVVAQIGLGMSVISQGVYGTIVLMSVATTLVAPPLLKWAYRDAPQRAPAARTPRIG